MNYLRSERRPVVLVLDKDAARKQLEYERKLAQVLGEDKVKALYLSEKDVADVGLKGVEGLGGFVRSRMG